MSERDPTERFLMTVPKPIHDWLSDQSRKLGVSIQDRLRVILEEEKNRQTKNWVKIPEMSSDETIEEFGKKLEKKCLQLGKNIYDKFAVERKRLTVVSMPDVESEEYKLLWEKHGLGDEFVVPIIQKNFQPLLDDKLYEYDICLAAKKVAEMENKLLSICEDGDVVFEALSFGVHVRFRDGRWRGGFRICLNSEKTISWEEIIRVTS